MANPRWPSENVFTPIFFFLCLRDLYRNVSWAFSQDSHTVHNSLIHSPAQVYI